ncbi:MAG TPA: XRE family transcriptional regulator [Deltaproteobacteria bacterium]|nr:MAG: XRE family transcriptional regulator [Deltaproteobacteria bacterium CG06_land_8_20_14_3_00_44_19]PIZ20359.1 MAG: XRE family transcriptional regulator [Deltaproteobacteria bacterium CG_4_10_14_0_8_um_filter_43_12]HCX89904.1 XRE family transcriptional regulator [Deltaproteobacteria bacterium]
MTMPGEDSKRYQHFLKELTEHFEDKESPDIVESVGERIKKIRETEGISLEELSTKTGFPIDLLSQIENQTVSPQIGTIIKLAKSLKTVFGTLTAEEGEKTYSIVRHGERKVVSRSASQKGHNYTYMSLASDVKGRHMESFIVKLEPETPDQELSAHDGEEFIFVIDGEMKARVGEKVGILFTGDTIYYLSNIPHLVASNRNEPTYILAVIYTGSD